MKLKKVLVVMVAVIALMGTTLQSGVGSNTVSAATKTTKKSTTKKKTTTKKKATTADKKKILNVYYINTGMSDAILIQKNGKNMLVDASDSKHGDKVNKFLKSKGVKKLDYVVITHYDSDHVGGLKKALKDIAVTKFVARKYSVDTLGVMKRNYKAWLEGKSNKLACPQYRNYYTFAQVVAEKTGKKIARWSIENQKLLAQNVTDMSKVGNTWKWVFLSDGNTINFDGAKLTFLNTPSTTMKSISDPKSGNKKFSSNFNQAINNDSLVFVLKYGSKKMLFTGDIERDGESYINNKATSVSLIKNCDFMKMPHHGLDCWQTSTLPKFLKNVNPTNTIITQVAGCKRKEYIYNAKSAIHKYIKSLYDAKKGKVYNTGRAKNAYVVTTNGKTISIANK